MTNTNTLQQVRSLIPTLTKPELDTLQQDVRQRIVEVAGNIKYELRPGVRVIVNGGKKLKQEKGRVVKVNRTRAEVRINGVIWNVPFTLLSLDERRETFGDGGPPDCPQITRNY